MTDALAAPPARHFDLSVLGAWLGLVAVLVLLGIKLVGGPQPPSERWEYAWLGAAYAGPFAIALLAGRFDGALRAGTWIGAGIVGFLLAFSSLAGVTLVLLPGALLLLGAGARELSGKRRGARAVPVVAVVVTAGVLSFLSPFVFLPPTPRCWDLHRVAGTEVWREMPVRPGFSAVAPAGVLSSCTSDSVTPVEAGLSLSAWAVPAVGLVLWDRRGRA